MRACKPGLNLTINGQTVGLIEAASQLLDQIKPLAELLDQGGDGELVSASWHLQKKRCLTPAKRPPHRHSRLSTRQAALNDGRSPAPSLIVKPSKPNR